MSARNAAALALLLVSTTAHAERWYRVADVERVSIEYHEVADWRTVEALANAPGKRQRQGYAVLVSRAGEYHCRVYLLAGADANARAHEERHCYGWAHR